MVWYFFKTHNKYLADIKSKIAASLNWVSSGQWAISQGKRDLILAEVIDTDGNKKAVYIVKCLEGRVSLNPRRFI